MGDVHEDMHQIKNHIELEQSAQKHTFDETQQSTVHTTKHVSDFMKSICHEFSSGDPNLTSVVSDTPGFKIGYVREGGPNPEPFSVSATCKGENVVIEVQDGKWQFSSNAMGNWGSWVDKKPVYSGTVDEARMRRVIKEAFLAWYRSSLQ